MAQGQLSVYRGCTPVVDIQYKKSSFKTPTEAIINALAKAEGVDPTNLSPLHDAIDLDAINQLFDQDNRGEDTETILSFRFESWNVFVRADGRIRVCDATQRVDPTPVFDGVES